jgi:hypothetical protein
MNLTKPTGPQLQQLVGNPDVYAVQDEVGDWKPVRARLTPGVIARHMRGDITVGTYIVKPPDQARTLVFDIDSPDEAEQDKMLNVLTQLVARLNLEYGVEFSGRKGYHVWILADSFMEADTLYRVGRGLRAEAGFPKLEVFPKQTTVRDLGNLVKLPGGVHRMTGKNNDFVGAFPGTNDNHALRALAEQYPDVRASMKRGGDVQAVEYPCVFALQDGVAEGERNTHLFHLATMLRKFSLSDENARLIVDAANARCHPPLDEGEIEGILDNSQWSGPVCDQLSEDYHCGDQCIKQRHPGLFTRPGALKWAADGEEVVMQVKSRTEDGHVAELEHPDAVQARAVLAEPPKRRGDEEQ